MMPTMTPQNRSASAVTAARPGRPRRPRKIALALLLGGAAFGALAQYKIVGPDGSVTYTDKPPTPADIRIGGATTGAGGSGLPYEVRQASSRYPVTLYAANNCAACDQARTWLRGRAVPFNEYSVNTDGDITQLRQKFSDTSVPVITIGTQTIHGYQASDLQGYIDAAGYPKGARLTGYTWPAATPLAPTRASAATPQSAAPAAPAVTLPQPSSSGIQF
jgi:glutaredoxin